MGFPEYAAAALTVGSLLAVLVLAIRDDRSTSRERLERMSDAEGTLGEAVKLMRVAARMTADAEEGVRARIEAVRKLEETRKHEEALAAINAEGAQAVVRVLESQAAATNRRSRYWDVFLVLVGLVALPIFRLVVDGVRSLF